jgi:hydroxyacylglutathione hydrolase
VASNLLIRALVVSPFATNCYLVSDAATRDALVIDPGADAATIIQAAQEDDLIVRGIVNTHGHADHIAANRAVKDEFDCPIMIHELDAPYLTDADLNLSSYIGQSGPLSPTADRLLEEGDGVMVGELLFRVIHTPGHTPGGICLIVDDVLFSGDTLFAGSIGRTDFPGGSHRALIESIRAKLLVLPENTAVYPGHGPSTTIAIERSSNPWL